MRENPGKGESDPAEGARRRCKKNFSSVLSCIERGQEKAVAVVAKSGQFTADKSGKGKFLRGNQRNLAGEGVVSKISSPQRIAYVFNLCNGRC